MPETSPNANIARHLTEMATRQPDVAALKVPQGRTATGDIDYLVLSFRELEREVDAWCRRLSIAGVRRGDRVLVMVRQGLPLIAAAFAIFKLGAIPILIDPGMGLKTFLNCVERSQPRVLLGITLAQLVSRIARRAFRSIEIRISASSSLTARLERAQRPSESSSAVPACTVASTDLAAVLFTSGSTGAPKGVCYEHGMFEAQIRAIQATYSIQPGEIDLPMLPIFALFNPALGMTTIVPEIDPRRPASVNPAAIVQAIQQEKVTNSFGSPTLWQKIGDHCVKNNVALPTLRRVLCAGAPVPASLWQSSRTWMPAGLLHSPYGATEALPVTSISADEVARAQGIGACVGRPVQATEIKIIACSDAPIVQLDPAQEKTEHEIGEIIVRGPTVTKSYDANPAATAAAKIPVSNLPEDPGSVSGSREVWHRMGDCGYIDGAGVLWFCGRKVERVETAAGTLFTEPCEKIFRAHPQVKRCALIGLGPRGQQEPAMVIEQKHADANSNRDLVTALRELARSSPLTVSIRRFYFHPAFPVDVRHNAKIHRLTLARWAETARTFEAPA
ncbi:MAG: fatty acid CoA ligase family protein [Opitutus sp.]